MHTIRSSRLAWLAALVAANTLVACGGDDDATLVDPPPTATNLADCHNPSMYTPGSSWTVRKKSVERVIDTGAVTVPMSEADFETRVTRASSDMGLGEGVVSWNDGSFFRVADGKVAELMTRTTGRLGVSWKYDPPILQPTSLPVGAVYTSPQSTVYFNSVYGGPDTVVNVGTQSHSLTFVAAETIAVAAGTFATCHVQLQQTSKSDVGQAYIVRDSWWVAGGPFKGIEVKSEKVYGGGEGSAKAPKPLQSARTGSNDQVLASECRVRPTGPVPVLPFVNRSTAGQRKRRLCSNAGPQRGRCLTWVATQRHNHSHARTIAQPAVRPLS